MSDTNSQPALLGLQPSFGFGDRLGLAGPGHIEATRQGDLIPILAQQSIRELDRTERTAEEVMQAAKDAVSSECWNSPWGADADHLKTPDDARRMSDAGYTFFTIDPSDYVDNRADTAQGSELQELAVAAAGPAGFETLAEVEAQYLNTKHDLGSESVSFNNTALLHCALIKYGRAIQHTEIMAQAIRALNPPQGFEIELSVDETDHPTTPLEHLFIGLELKRRCVDVVSLAPRFVGHCEKAIDYKGDLSLFESTLETHTAIARYCGPYKLSLHSGSDKFAIYPIMRKVCGNLLHVKTAGTSYLEALRVIARTNDQLFSEIITYSMRRFDEDRATYHISADVSRLDPPKSLSASDRERQYLDEDDGRQVMHVTFGSVLTKGSSSNGQTLREAIMDVLEQHADLHKELLAAHLGKHVRQLKK